MCGTKTIMRTTAENSKRESDKVQEIATWASMLVPVRISVLGWCLPMWSEGVEVMITQRSGTG